MEWTSFPQSKLFLLSCVISLQWVIFIKLLYKEGDYYYCYNLDPIAPSSAEAAFRWLCCTSFSLFCGLCKILQCSNEAAKWANLLGIGNLMREEVRVIPMSLLMNNTLLSCPLSLSLSLSPPLLLSQVWLFTWGWWSGPSCGAAWRIGSADGRPSSSPSPSTACLPSSRPSSRATSPSSSAAWPLVWGKRTDESHADTAGRAGNETVTTRRGASVDLTVGAMPHVRGRIKNTALIFTKSILRYLGVCGICFISGCFDFLQTDLFTCF